MGNNTCKETDRCHRLKFLPTVRKNIIRSLFDGFFQICESINLRYFAHVYTFIVCIEQMKAYSLLTN